MELEDILREVRSLKRKIQHFSGEIESMKAVLREDPLFVERILRTRGLHVFRENPTDQLFIPPGLPPSSQTQFYELMKKYSFRLVARDMIKRHDHFHIQELTHYCSSRVAQRYADLLSEMGVIVKLGREEYRTSVYPLYSFGPTLEWFIAEMFKREFASPAIYRVSIKGTASGGDYDVLSCWDRRLVYVEVKSSPPRGVELSEVTAFFSRVEELLPDVAILFNDTQLRMRDKLVVLFEDELKQRYGKKAKPHFPVVRLAGELFHLQNHIFIINSKKGIVDNFSTCLKHYLRHGERRR